MFLKPTLLALLLSATTSLAVDGRVKLYYPENTYSHGTPGPYEMGVAGAWREYPSTEAITRSFNWYGPQIGDSDDRAWKQTCGVSVDKDFKCDKLIEIHLQAKAEGLGETKVPEHSGKVTIRCKDAECTLPDGGECKDKNVIPHVDLSV